MFYIYKRTAPDKDIWVLCHSQHGDKIPYKYRNNPNFKIKEEFNMTTKPKTTGELTPMQTQFYDLKKKHPDAVLLFRCGDFYEAYADDAAVISQVLGVTLTRNFKMKEEDGHGWRQAGFPYHALDTYLPKLVRAGRRVAICDQIDGATKTIKRTHSVTEISTPKTSTEMKENEEVQNVSEEGIEAITLASHNQEIEELKKETHQKLLRMAAETIKALNGTLPATLNAYYSEALGKLELIKVKVQNNAKPTADEMNYLISMAEKGEKAA